MLQAFNNDKDFREQMIASAISHREKDEYIAGEYSREDGDFKGCSLGCSLYDVKKIKGVDIEVYSDHSRLAEELGVPEFIVHLQEAVFEGLPDNQRFGWTERLFNSIPLGVDLTPVLPRFLLKTLDRLPETDRADVVAAIKGVKEVLDNWVSTGEVDFEAARSAARLAESAAYSALKWSARSAAWAAKSAARSAEWSAKPAEWSAESAVWSAEWSAKSAAWEEIANDLISCIEECATSQG